MGILNVTPDSFSDGGRYLAPAAALARGAEMIDEGADLVDVGGESSRPGARPVPEAEELRRVVAVVEGLAGRVRLSVDTRRASVARAAVRAGATLINDISASLWPVAADEGVGWVAMHMRGTPPDMQDDPRYDDVVAEVRDLLSDRAARAVAAGVGEVWIDPGIGFGKTTAHNLALLAGVPALVEAAADHGAAGVLVGTSRKGFLGRFGAAADRPRPVEDRLEASLATAVWAMESGAAMVRVHDVGPTRDAADLVGPRLVAGSAP